MGTYADADFRFVAMPVGAYAKPGDNADLQRNATVRSAATRPQRRPPPPCPPCELDAQSRRDLPSQELFGDAPTVYVSRTGLLTREECKQAIQTGTPNTHEGWSTSRPAPNRLLTRSRPPM